MKKFENIVIATDLDGTFFGKGATLVRRNLEAVKYFTDNGGYFTIATGRFPYHVRMVFDEVEQYTNLPAATCNGACMYDFSKNEVMSIKDIPSELMIELAEFVREVEPRAALRASCSDVYFVCVPEALENKYIAAELARIGDDARLIIPLEQWRDKVFYKTVIRADKDIIDELKPKIAKHFAGRLFVTQSASTLIDIQIAGCDKGKGIRRIMTEFLGEGKTLYTCGDYLNDIELHEAADVSVCPSNAHEEIKKMCDLCLCSNDEGLIADLIEHIENRL